MTNVKKERCTTFSCRKVILFNDAGIGKTLPAKWQVQEFRPPRRTDAVLRLEVNARIGKPVKDSAIGGRGAEPGFRILLGSEWAHHRVCILGSAPRLHSGLGNPFFSATADRAYRSRGVLLLVRQSIFHSPT